MQSGTLELIGSPITRLVVDEPIKKVICSNSAVAELIVNSQSLDHLDCGYCQLHELTPNPKLQVLICINNPLRQLHLDKLTSLTVLFCSHCPLGTLDVSHIVTLRELFCQHCGLTSIDFPDTLELLACNNNQISSIHKLCVHSNFDYNSITQLPEFPLGMNFLSIAGNPICELPSLPDTLDYLDVVNTRITRLPTLPAILQDLSVSHTNICELPTLPDTMEDLYCENTPIRWLPNLPPMVDVIYGVHHSFIQNSIVPCEFPSLLEIAIQHVSHHARTNICELDEKLHDRCECACGAFTWLRESIVLQANDTYPNHKLPVRQKMCWRCCRSCRF